MKDLSLSGNERNHFFRNDQGRFVEVAWPVGLASSKDGRSFVAADFDRDGDLDVFLVNSLQPWQYFENRHPNPGNWLVVQLKGRKSNRFGIGSRVRVKAGKRWFTREIHVGSGYLGSPPPEAHFGLGSAKRIERIEIRWPSGLVQRIRSVKVNQVIQVDEGKPASALEPLELETIWNE